MFPWTHVFDNLLDATARQCGLSKCGPPSSIGGEGKKDKNRVLTATVAQYITHFFCVFIHSFTTLVNPQPVREN